MKLKSLLALALLIVSAQFVQAQITAQIGTGNDVPANTLYSPVYRFSATSTTTAVKSDILFTQAELAAAGIYAGSTITKLEFNKTNVDSFIVPANYTLYMGNTANTTLPTTTTWASILTSHTQVYTSSAFKLPNTSGWVAINVSPFVYTGGSLEIASDLTMTGNGGASGPFKWEYTATTPATMIVGVTGTGTTLNGSVAAYKYRPNIKITYSPAASINGALSLITSPTSICPSATDVAVDFSNAGLDTITSAIINWSVNGVLQTPDTFVGALAQGASINLTLGSYSFASGTSYDLVCFISSVNGVADPFTSNDTLTKLGFLTGLSGNYTINSGASTSGTNFASFTAFAQALNAYGVCGAVVATVTPGSGPYNEQIKFNQILGASSINTVTIKGNNEILTFAPTVGANYIVALDGTDYFTIDSLKLIGTDPTYGGGLVLTNGTSRNIIQNCTIDLSAVTGTGTTSAGIALTGSFSSFTTIGYVGGQNLFMNNVIKGGAIGGPYYGITTAGVAGAVGTNENQFIGNKISDFYSYGLRLQNMNTSFVSQNEIFRPLRSTTTTFYGIYVATLAPNTIIEKNLVHDAFTGIPTSTSTCYPFYFTGLATVPGQEVVVKNNLVYNINGAGTIYNYYLSAAKGLNIYHNTVAIDGGSGTNATYGLYTTSTNDSIRYVNNIMSITRNSTGAKYGYYLSSTPPNFYANNNDIYVSSASGTNAVGYISATPQLTLLDWQTATFEDSNSVTIDPSFGSLLIPDLTPSAGPLNNSGANLQAIVNDDYNGVARPITPDMGALEFTPLNDEAGVTEIINGFCASITDSIYVRVKNYGLVTLTSVKVYCTVDGTPTPNSSNTFNLNVTSGNDTVLNLGAYSFAPGSTPQIIAFTSLPNTNADANTANDTLAKTEFLGLNGNYTINSALPTSGINFQTLNDAATALNNYGVCGPVVFDVAVGSGPYINDQVTLNQINGASAINTITFHGHGERAEFLSTYTAKRAQFNFNGSDYVTVDSFVIVALGSTTSQYGVGFALYNTTDYNQIIGNKIYVDSTLGSINYAGVFISASASSATTSGAATGTNNLISGNEIYGGYYGISVVGQSTSILRKNNRIINNTISGFFYYGLYNYYQDSSVISGNTVTGGRYSYTTFPTTQYGLYPYYNDNAVISNNTVSVRATTTVYGINVYTNDNFVVENNKVLVDSGTTSYGIYVYAGKSSNFLIPTKVTNNFVTCTNGTTVYGIYPYNCAYVDVIHNSVNVTGGSATAGRAFYINRTSGAYNDLRIFNNIGVNTGLGYAIEVSNSAHSLGYITGMDNNDWYGTGVAPYRYNNINCATISAWKSTSAWDTNSVAVSPLFTSITDLHVVSNFLNDRGKTGLGVSVDIDGDVRCPQPGCAGSTLRPDIGADEFLGTPVSIDLAMDAILSPVQKQCYTNAEVVKVRVKNANAQTIYFGVNPVTVTVSVTGPNPTTFPAVVINADSLLADSTLELTISASYDMSALGTYSFKAIVSEPSDALGYNDTLNKTVVFSVGSIANKTAQICAGGNHTLRLNGVVGPIQWQSYDSVNTVWVNESGTNFDSVVYTVTPTTTQLYRALVCGTFISDSVLVTVNNPQSPVVSHDTICGPGVATLSATAGGTLKWYDSPLATTVLTTGATYSPNVTSTDTFYVQNSEGLGNIENVGRTTNGTSTFITQTIGWGLNFTANVDFLLQSVTVFPVGTGTMTIHILSPTNTILQSSAPVNVSGTGGATPNVVPVNLTIPQGSYKIGMTSTGITNLVRESSGNTYPYTSPSNAVSITSGNTGTSTTSSSYYWFYNWQIATPCVSPRIPVVATVNPLPTVNVGNDTTLCPSSTLTLDAGNSGSTYAWNDLTTNQTNTVSTAGLYSVTVTNAAGCAKADSIQVDVASPIVVDLGADTTQCAGTIVLDAGNATLSHLWSDATTTQTLTASTSGSYSVKVTDAFGCNAFDTVLVTIHSNPIVDLGADTTQCAGTVTLNAGNTGVGYLWNDASSAQTLIASNTGTYSVVVTDANGCKGTDTVDVTIHSLPIVQLGADTAQCAGTVLLDAGNTGASYVWNDATTAQTLTASVTGTYAVEVTDGNGCKASDSILVSIYANPVVNLGADTSSCGGTVTLDAGNAGANYLWNNATTLQQLNATVSGTYSVLVTTANGCKASDTVVVTINSNPVVALGADTAQCSGTVSLNAGNAGATYLWSNASTTQTIVATASGLYAVEVTNSNGCKGSDTIVVTLYALPTVNLGADKTQCGGSVNLDAGNTGASFLWSTGASSQNISASSTGVYSVKVTDANGCTKGDTVNVTINALPTVSLAVPQDTICSNAGTISLSGGLPMGGVYSGTGVASNIFNPSVAGVGKDTITYSYTDANGCSATATDVIVVKLCTGIDEPRQLSPVSVYPNPTEHTIYVEGLPFASNAVFQIVDMQGKLIQETILSSASSSYQIDVTDLASGMYMLRISSGAESFLGRFTRK
jgi:hypothetical protein